jgi:glycosyltransferase involved in cell wall biosynthesis
LGFEHLRFIGNVSDVAPWIAAADVLLHTARLDAFPLVCLHSALAGTPVVGFDGVGGLREMMGEATVSAPYPDVTALARTVEALAQAETRQCLGIAQQQRVVTHFTAAVAAETLLHHLCEVTRPSPPGAAA